MKSTRKKAAGGQAPATDAKPKATAAAAPEAPSDAKPAVEEATPEKSSAVEAAPETPSDAKPAVEAAPATYESILAQIKKAQEAK